MFRMFRIIRIIRIIWSFRGERGMRATGVREGGCQTFFMFETKALAVPNFRKRSMRMGMWRESSVT